MDMPVPENFSQYIKQLEYLLQQRPDVVDAYIDFGCRFKVTWQRYVESHPSLPPEAAQLRIMVNWLHAAGHELACELVNSGRYSEGAGWRVGEELEHLWSLTKVRPQVPWLMFLQCLLYVGCSLSVPFCLCFAMYRLQRVL